MRSKEAAQLLRKWIESQQFKGWSDYWVQRVIDQLEADDFFFSELTPSEKVQIPQLDEEDPSTTDIEVQPAQQAAVALKTSTDNWLQF